MYRSSSVFGRRSTFSDSGPREVAAVVLIVFGLILGGCGDSSQTSFTTDAGELEIDPEVQGIADAALIELFFLRYLTAWSQEELEGAIRFNVERSHPDLEYAEELWRCEGRLHIAGPAVFVDDSVNPADGWVFPGSPHLTTPLDGTVPRGRLYEVDVQPLEAVDGTVGVSSETVTLHVAVINDEEGTPKVHWFPIPYCD